MRSKFQFHKGTIKTDLSHRHMFTAQPFQFHKGTIKTRISPTTSRPSSEFQFHKGTIKTIMLSSEYSELNSISIP